MTSRSAGRFQVKPIRARAEFTSFFRCTEFLFGVINRNRPFAVSVWGSRECRLVRLSADVSKRQQANHTHKPSGLRNAVAQSRFRLHVSPAVGRPRLGFGLGLQPTVMKARAGFRSTARVARPFGARARPRIQIVGLGLHARPAFRIAAGCASDGPNRRTGSGRAGRRAGGAKRARRAAS
jgi:hypothetical protein